MFTFFFFCDKILYEILDRIRLNNGWRGLMKIYVVRHGQTDYNVKKLFLGHLDIPLNEKGILQAKETAQKFKNVKIDYILVSPLQRTIQTAEYINEVTKTKLIIENRLIERSFGNMEGRANTPEWNIEMMLDYNKNYAYENVEPIKSLFKRVYDFLDDITQRYSDKQILLVTHGGVSQPIDCYFNGMPEEMTFNSFEKITLKNCEIKKYIYIDKNKTRK